MVWGDLKPESKTLATLPPNLRSGLTAISVLAFISFFASTVLFFYLTYKLIAWHFFIPQAAAGHQPPQNTFQRKMDFALGIDTIFSEDHKVQGEAVEAQPVRQQRGKPNQFLILIFNLLLADMHQATAFLLNSSWLQHDGIIVEEPACFAQGLFVSLGDLASSMFITAIAVHTYFSVVTKYHITHGALYFVICAIWVFVYAISLIPVAVTRNGDAVGGFFVRAGAWVSRT
jgi:hypothetical protein